MRIIDLPPIAPTLLEAMRAVGYSFETAIADIIDNSISARATQIDVFFSPYGDPYVAILDDGIGMDGLQLRNAMRHGSRNTWAENAEGDLGRFGLGLKTASLSQCRSLTVVSISPGRKISGARWDLDEVSRLQSWAMIELDGYELDSIPEISSLRQKGQGTLVVWQKMDRLFAGESSQDRALQNKIDDTRSHLSLVYHRFLEPNISRPALSIRINNASVSASDPYLRTCRGSQLLPPEYFNVDESCVAVEAHILPHISRLSLDEIEAAGGHEGLRRNQGFYVYRNYRLIIWGTWFRLARQEEMTKLARVMVDVPTSLDHLWTLDIKKSTAHPPEAVRTGLRRIVERIAETSRRVYTFRGRKSTAAGIVHGWQRIEHRGGTVEYRINRDHDLINAIRSVVPEENERLLEHFLQALERSFPFDAVYADMAGERRISEDIEDADLEESLLDAAQLLIDAVKPDVNAAVILKNRIHLLEPFSRYPDITARIKERIIC
jgi:hypothetical protein